VGELVAGVIAVAVVVAWLTSVVVAFRKGRPWAASAGLAVPFFLVGVFMWGLTSCLGGSGDCSAENAVTYWAILLALGIVVWVVAAALLPRSEARESTRGETRSDRSLSGWGLVFAGVSAAFGVWAIASRPPYPSWTDALNLIGAGCSVVCAVGLVLVTVRHRTHYPDGPGRWLVTAGWIAAAITLVYVASPGPYFEEGMSRIGESSPFIAAALAVACLGLFHDSRTLNRNTVPLNRPRSTP
jgi:hypothetical protein